MPTCSPRVSSRLVGAGRVEQVAPSKFSGDALDVLTAQIEGKFADRVIANVGLCICLHSYESIGDPYVYPSDGAAHYKVYLHFYG